MTNKIISARANAKVNLALHVVGQRIDGLHILDSLVAFPDFGDDLFFKQADKLTLSISGPFGDQLVQESKNNCNIILRAAKLLKGDSCGASIKLVKNLPVASGIGGGSANAALTLKALSLIWKKKL